MIAEIINPSTLGFILVAVMLFAIFYGDDRTGSCRRTTLCLYGNYDGTGGLDGKIILIGSTHVSQS